MHTTPHTHLCLRVYYACSPPANSHHLYQPRLRLPSDSTPHTPTYHYTTIFSTWTGLQRYTHVTRTPCTPTLPDSWRTTRRAAGHSFYTPTMPVFPNILLTYHAAGAIGSPLLGFSILRAHAHDYHLHSTHTLAHRGLRLPTFTPPRIKHVAHAHAFTHDTPFPCSLTLPPLHRISQHVPAHRTRAGPRYYLRLGALRGYRRGATGMFHRSPRRALPSSATTAPPTTPHAIAACQALPAPHHHPTHPHYLPT